MKEKKVKLKRVKKGRNGKIKNLPAEIVALGEKLQAEQRRRQIIIMMDEAYCNNAPKEKDQASFNWTGLDKIPDQLTLILMFNPGSYEGRHLLLPPSCLQLKLSTTYRSTKSISNLHSRLATVLKLKTPHGTPGTEVMGELPRLVPLGDLGEEEEAAAEKIKHGFKLMKGFMGEEDVAVIIDDNRYLSDSIGKLVKKESEAIGWKNRTVSEMYGAEADRVVYFGRGGLEAISRARLSLGILLCCQSEESKRYYNFATKGFRAAIEEGLVLVATPPSHPQVADNILSMSSFVFQPGTARN